MTFETGPYLQAALFCEKVLNESDGVLSFIRVIDRWTVNVIGAHAPEEMPRAHFSDSLVVMLKSGEARGVHKVSIRPEKPSGHRMQATEIAAELNGEERGQNVVLNIELEIEEQGLYWFDVLFDGTLMTRVPLRVVYLFMSAG